MSFPDPESSAGYPNPAQSSWTEDSDASYAAPQYTPLDESLPVVPATAFDLVWWLYATVVVLAVFWIYTIGASYLATYRLRREMLERRRRAGIPDEDSRPFDIAYAAAAVRRREEDEEKMRAERERSRAAHDQNSDWAQLGRTIGAPQDRYLAHRGLPTPRLAGLVQRFPAPQQQLFPTSHSTAIPDYSGQSQRQPLPQYRGYLHVQHQQPIDSPTISSSDSPPHPAPPVWEDQYAPPEIRAAHEAQRQRAVAVPSTLGRRSRKELVLDDDEGSGTDSGHQERSRRRLDKWGQEDAIDGDNDAKWAGAQKTQLNGILSNRIRKRDDDTEEEADDQESRAKSKRKVAQGSNDPAMPGGFQLSAGSGHPTSAIAGPGKRKARDEEESLVDVTKAVKQKKRVRVLSYHESKDKEQQDQDMRPDEEPTMVERAPKVGDEWMVGNVKHKMSDNGLELVEGYVKEQKNVLKSSNRYSPSKTVVTVTKRWMSQNEYAKAEKAGLLTDEFDADAIIAEIKLPSRPGSDGASDWGSIVGQTPLKTGGMKTGLGSDRPAPPFASLPQANKLAIEQSRLLHMASPRSKNPMPYGSRKGGMNAPISPWDKKKKEAAALEAVRAARRTQSGNAKLATATPTPAVTTPTTSTPAPKPAVEPLKAAATAPALFSFNPPTAAANSTAAIAPAPTPSTFTASNPFAPKPAEVTKPQEVHKPQETPKPAEPFKLTEAPKALEATKPSGFSFSTPAITLTGPTPAPSMVGPTAATATDKPTPAPASTPFLGGFNMPKPPLSNTASSNLFSFGSTPSASAIPKPPALFGAAPSNTPGASLFGATPANNTSNTPLFGAAPTSTTPAAASTTNGFGSTPAAPAPAPPTQAPTPFSFGSTFGQQSVASSPFGAPPSNPSQPQQTSSMTPASTSTSNLFGNNTTAAKPASTFGFGTSFGGPPKDNASTPAPLSFPSNTGPAAAPGPPTPAFGGFGGFGTQTPAADKPAQGGFSIMGAAKPNEPLKVEPPKSFGFGSTPANGQTFLGVNNGVPSGANTPTTPSFGSTANKPPPFGAFGNGGGFGVANGNSTLFGGPVSTPSSPFAFGAKPEGEGAPAGTPVAPVFNLGTPPPQSRPSKPLPRPRR